MLEALYKKCTDTESIQEHEMKDGCWTCAPWWNIYPICPLHKNKLLQSGKNKGYCRQCRKYYKVMNI